MKDVDVDPGQAQLQARMKYTVLCNWRTNITDIGRRMRTITNYFTENVNKKFAFSCRLLYYLWKSYESNLDQNTHQHIQYIDLLEIYQDNDKLRNPNMQRYCFHYLNIRILK